MQGRCAAVLMFHTQLALLPAMETEGLELDLMMDDPYGEGVQGLGGAPAELVSATVGNSYVVNLAKMGIKQVRITFEMESAEIVELDVESGYNMHTLHCRRPESGCTTLI